MLYVNCFQIRRLKHFSPAFWSKTEAVFKENKGECHQLQNKAVNYIHYRLFDCGFVLKLCCFYSLPTFLLSLAVVCTPSAQRL